MKFPERKPVDHSEVNRLVSRILCGARDSSLFGGIVYGVKRHGFNGLHVLISTGEGGIPFVFVRCTKNTANAVMDVIANDVQSESVFVYPDRY